MLRECNESVLRECVLRGFVKRVISLQYGGDVLACYVAG